ncbi:MAG: cytochrome-c peroxidase [Bacteroidota bacterium]
MKISFLVILTCCSVVSISFFFELKEHPFFIPQGWPKPVYDFENNPLSKNKFELGRTLFYDPDLSRDSTISCASCHLQFSGFTHIDHALSHGIDGKIGTRNSPVLINLAWNKFFHWDGGAGDLNQQAINPLTHPKEMDNNLKEILRRLNNSAFYRRRFYNSFGDSAITTEKLLKSLANFTVSLVSSNSKYDRFKRGVEEFNEQENNGYRLFQKYCASCHAEPLFKIDVFKNNGLTLDLELKDEGRKVITGNLKDFASFKVPTLRNVEFSFPYMHDGRYKKLRDVINHYSSLPSQKDSFSKELKKIKKPFSDSQSKDLIAFLKTLSDKEFLYNPIFRFQKNERQAQEK